MFFTALWGFRITNLCLHCAFRSSLVKIYVFCPRNVKHDRRGKPTPCLDPRSLPVMPGFLLVSVGLKKLWRLESLQQGGSLLTVASLNFIAWSCFKELISIVCLTFHVLFFSFKLYLAVLGLGCCAWVFSSCGEQGLLCSWSVVTSLVVKHGLWSAGSAFVAHGLSCSAAYGILVPGTGMETMPPALAGRFFTTGPPGKKEASRVRASQRRGWVPIVPTHRPEFMSSRFDFSTKDLRDAVGHGVLVLNEIMIH